MTGDYSMSKGKKIQTEKQRDMYKLRHMVEKVLIWRNKDPNSFA